MTTVMAQATPARVVVVGLGIGTLAAYGRPGDRFSFFEIDPQVVALSTGTTPVFTYLRDSAATIDLVVGDGRLALERTPTLAADIVVADAFSSDAVPVHLLTREAMALYVSHLRDRRGLVAVHISNRYLALADVVAAAGAANGLAAVRVEDADVPGLVRATDWMLLSRDPAVLRPFGQPYVGDGRPWTDAWSDPWRAFHW
jgi:spermidine synthase